LQPNYILSQSPTKTVLRNFEGVITTYPEPEHYTPGLADDYFKEIYPNAEDKRSNIGISGLLNDAEFNLVPKGLKRIDRREELQSKPEHATLKDQREKRDQLKEKKFQAQQKKNTPSSKGDE
jgi:lysine 2,3-aminomutase